jgi:signal peptidase
VNNRIRRVLITLIASVTLFLTPFISGLFPSVIEFYALLFILIGVVLFLFFTMGSSFLYMRFNRDVYRSLFLGAMFLIVLFEPFLILHARFTFSLDSLLAYRLVQIFLFAIIIQAMIFNLNMKSLVKTGKLTTLLPYIALFLFINLTIETVLLAFSGNPQIIITILFQLFDDVVLFVLLSVLYVRTRMNNLTGMVFYALYSASGFFVIVTKVDAFILTFWNFIVLGVMFLVLELVMNDNFYSRKIFTGDRTEGKTRHKHDSMLEKGVVIGVVVFAIFILVLFPVIMGTAHPIYVDPTGSMYPIIKPDSLLIVKGVNVQSIHIGNIIVFTAPWDKTLTVAHQVIGINHLNGTIFFITKGFANPVKDPAPVPAGNVHGIVIQAIPYLGYFFIYLYVILPMMLIPMIVKIK